MIGFRTFTILVLACLAAAGGWWLQNRGLRQTPTQQAAPAGATVYGKGHVVSVYALPSLTGQTTSLSKWHGKVLLINFWATWCAPCRAEMPMLAEMQRKYAAEGLQIVGVAMDQPQAATAFLKALHVGYPILVGINADPLPTTTFGDTGGALPYSVLVDRSGRIVATRLGALDPEIVKDWLARADGH